MSVHQLADRLRHARRITALTGAGVSAGSGVPTFRGPHGLWRHYRAEDLATPDAFARDARLVWEWYAWRRDQIAQCRPNEAHRVLASWSQRAVCQVVTQNVDDLHRQAGTVNLVRLHGSIWELSCWAKCAAGAEPWRDERVPLPDLPPKCPHCGGLARPSVVWFGEALRRLDLEAAEAAARCDVFLAIGTAAAVYPAAGLVHRARARGAFTAEINVEATAATGAVDLTINGPAECILPELEALWTPS